MTKFLNDLWELAWFIVGGVLSIFIWIGAFLLALAFQAIPLAIAIVIALFIIGRFAS